MSSWKPVLLDCVRELNRSNAPSAGDILANYADASDPLSLPRNVSIERTYVDSGTAPGFTEFGFCPVTDIKGVPFFSHVPAGFQLLEHPSELLGQYRQNSLNICRIDGVAMPCFVQGVKFSDNTSEAASIVSEDRDCFGSKVELRLIVLSELALPYEKTVICGNDVITPQWDHKPHVAFRAYMDLDKQTVWVRGSEACSESFHLFDDDEGSNERLTSFRVLSLPEFKGWWREVGDPVLRAQTKLQCG